MGAQKKRGAWVYYFVLVTFGLKSKKSFHECKTLLKCRFGLFHVKRTLLFSQRVKIQLLPIHSKHMVNYDLLDVQN